MCWIEMKLKDYLEMKGWLPCVANTTRTTPSSCCKLCKMTFMLWLAVLANTKQKLCTLVLHSWSWADSTVGRFKILLLQSVMWNLKGHFETWLGRPLQINFLFPRYYYLLLFVAGNLHFNPWTVEVVFINCWSCSILALSIWRSKWQALLASFLQCQRFD